MRRSPTSSASRRSTRASATTSLVSAINRAAGGAPVADRRGDRGAPALRRRLPRRVARALRHHVGRAAPRLGLQARDRRVFPTRARSTRCCRSSTGARSSGTSGRSVCRARAWRSTSAASARNTPPTASRRSRIDAGIAHGFVNLAGDVRVWGGRPDGGPWRVGIRHPRVDDATIGGIDVGDGAVATSAATTSAPSSSTAAATATSSTPRPAGRSTAGSR